MRLSFERFVQATIVAASFAFVGCYNEGSLLDPPASTLDVQLSAAIQGSSVFPVAEVPRLNPALVALGRTLFFEKELSGNRDISCGTCHDPLAHGADKLSLAVGTGGVGTLEARRPGTGRQFVPRNAPSILNQVLTFPYIFWDGRLIDRTLVRAIDSSFSVVFPPGLSSGLAMQAMLPVLNRAEMRGAVGDRDVFGNVNEIAAIPDSASSEIWNAVMRRLLRINGYEALFSSAYPFVPATSLGFQHAANAIAAFELDALTRTNSAFDRFLKRDKRAMSDEAKRGGILFFSTARCVQCHRGPALGGQQFANIGIPQIGPGMGKSAPLDIGRGDVVQQIGGPPPPVGGPVRFAFRVAPLRNVELTAPYMHNGAYPTLEAVVRHYTNADSSLKSYDVTQLAPALRSSYHGDAGTIAAVAQTLDFRIQQPIPLTATQQAEIVAFLKSLTDPAARDLSAITPDRVPSGLPVK